MNLQLDGTFSVLTLPSRIRLHLYCFKVDLTDCLLLQLDFPFRGVEDVLEELPAQPKGAVMDCYKEIKILPNTRPRSVTLLQMAVPPQLTQGETCGILVMSVRHPDSQKRPVCLH